MSRYVAKVRTADPERLEGLQPGQWIDYQGTLGRWLAPGRIAWSGTARKRFAKFAAAYRN